MSLPWPRPSHLEPAWQSWRTRCSRQDSARQVRRRAVLDLSRDGRGEVGLRRSVRPDHHTGARCRFAIVDRRAAERLAGGPDPLPRSGPRIAPHTGFVDPHGEAFAGGADSVRCSFRRQFGRRGGCQLQWRGPDGYGAAGCLITGMLNAEGKAGKLAKPLLTAHFDSSSTG